VARAPIQQPWRNRSGWLRGIDDMHQDIGVTDRSERGVAHRAVQSVFGFEQPWCVENDHLRVILCAQTENAVAGTLRFARGYGELLTDESVKQGGFAGVGETGDRNDTSPCHELGFG